VNDTAKSYGVVPQRWREAGDGPTEGTKSIEIGRSGTRLERLTCLVEQPEVEALATEPLFVYRRRAEHQLRGSALLHRIDPERVIEPRVG